MTESKNQRIKSLSTRYLALYKHGVLAILITFAGLLTYQKVNSWLHAGSFGPLFGFAYVMILIVIWIRINRNIYRVAFDDDFLYVILHRQDIVIPLENIRDVNIVTLGGVYRVELYSAEQLGEKFYFKPSLLYPFNYKKKDALVDVLREKIGNAKRRKPSPVANALHS
jgi:hypothetical protein